MSPRSSGEQQHLSTATSQKYLFTSITITEDIIKWGLYSNFYSFSIVFISMNSAKHGNLHLTMYTTYQVGLRQEYLETAMKTKD